MNVDETKRLLRVLGAAYQNATVDDDVIQLWASRLSGQPLDGAMATAIEWVDNERNFPRVSEFLAAMEDRARRYAARSALQAAPCVCESGWVEVPDAEHPGTHTVRPCERCAPETYALWAGGHYEPGHHCPACEERRRGRRAS